jgi:protein TonB
MDANKILGADVLDIVFEGKNKEYGAYNLRKTYNKRITIALLVTAGAVALLFLINFLLNAFHKDEAVVVYKDTDVSLSSAKKEAPLPPPPKATLPSPPVKTATVQFTPPVVKKNNEVPKDVKPPDQKTVEQTTISDVTQQGVKDPGVVTPPAVPTGTSVVEGPENNGLPFEKVEIQAGFPGGPAAWQRYLKNNLNTQLFYDNAATPGSYKVVVRFVVAVDGTISDVEAKTNWGYGMEEEVIRVIKSGPKWIPAQQNGHSVPAYREQPIVINVEEQ